MMAARTPPTAAETIRSIPTLRCCVLRSCGTILRPSDGLAFTIYVRAIVRAIRLPSFWFSVFVSSRRGGRRRCLVLRDYLLREKGYDQEDKNVGVKASHLFDPPTGVNPLPL
jgi:hypothetical protein